MCVCVCVCVWLLHLETNSLNKSSINGVEFCGEQHFHSDSPLSSSMFFCSSSFTLKCVLLYLDFIYNLCRLTDQQRDRPDKDPLKYSQQSMSVSFEAIYTLTQGRLKITRGPWATALRQAPLYSRKPFFLSFLTTIYVKFRLLICQVTFSTLFCVKCEYK